MRALGWVRWAYGQRGFHERSLSEGAPGLGGATALVVFGAVGVVGYAGRPRLGRWSVFGGGWFASDPRLGQALVFHRGSVFGHCLSTGHGCIWSRRTAERRKG